MKLSWFAAIIVLVHSANCQVFTENSTFEIPNSLEHANNNSQTISALLTYTFLVKTDHDSILQHESIHKGFLTTTSVSFVFIENS